MCAKFGCGPTVVSKKRGGTDRQTDRQRDTAALYSRLAQIHQPPLAWNYCKHKNIQTRQNSPARIIGSFPNHSPYLILLLLPGRLLVFLHVVAVTVAVVPLGRSAAVH